MKDPWSAVKLSTNLKCFLYLTVLSQNGCLLEIHVHGLRRVGLARCSNLRQDAETSRSC